MRLTSPAEKGNIFIFRQAIMLRSSED